jgi:Putative Actinobacterial Holin-X, holin superfamily III
MAAESAVVVLDDEVTSMGEAVEQVLRAASAVMEDRIELGRLELSEQSSRVGTGLACFGVSVFFGACAWVALLAAASVGLGRMLPEDVSLAVVAGANLLLAAVLASLGRRRITRSPEER